jgi:hypothetical protein
VASPVHKCLWTFVRELRGRISERGGAQEGRWAAVEASELTPDAVHTRFRRPPGPQDPHTTPSYLQGRESVMLSGHMHWEDIDGWTHFEDVYDLAVGRLETGVSSSRSALECSAAPPTWARVSPSPGSAYSSLPSTISRALVVKKLQPDLPLPDPPRVR